MPQQTIHLDQLVFDLAQSDVDDQVLLDQLSPGDPTAFWVIWLRHREELLNRYCLRWCNGNREEAEDALSNASLKALRLMPSHAARITNVKGWLIRLLYQQCMDALRIHRRQRALWDRFTHTENVEQRATTRIDSPEDAVLGKEFRQHFFHAITQLPPALREISHLHFIQNASHAAIADQLGLSPATVRKRAQNARLHLQQALLNDSRQQPTPKTNMLPPEAYCHTEASLYTAVDPRYQMVPPLSHSLRLMAVTLPNEIETFVQIAVDHKPKRQQQKIDTLRSYTRKHPRGWKKQLAFANCLYNQGDWHDAITIYRQVLQKQMYCLLAYLRLGEMLQTFRQYEEALTVYKSVLTLFYHEGTRHHARGLIAVCQRHWKKAAKAFTDATQANPDNIAHWNALGQTALKIGQTDIALQAFNQVLKTSPFDSIALTYSYDTLQAIDHNTEAQRRLERAVEIDPENLPALKRLIDVRIGMGLYDGAEGKQTWCLLRRAQRFASEAPQVQDSLTRYYISRGETDKALDIWQDFTRRHPRSPAGWRHAAFWYRHTNDLTSAVFAIKQAHALVPYDDHVQEEMRVMALALPTE